MAGKRTASTELNHDNWDEEYESEEAGTFKRASQDVIARRVIKVAKRRNPISEEGGSNSPNIFSSFGGFTKPAAAATTSASPFAFLSNLTNTTQSNTNGLATSTSKTTNPNLSTTTLFKNSSMHSTSNDKSTETSSAYLEKLQALNESVAKWIQTHVDKNPHCLLTPVFKDYEKHLAEIEKLKEEKASGEGSTEFKLPTPSESKTLQATSHSSSIFGKVDSSKSNDNPFLSKSANKIEEKRKDTSATSTISLPTPGFTFGNTKLPTSPPSSGFTFGSGTPFKFSNVAKPPGTDDKKTEENPEEEEPPKNEFTPVVEDNSLFTKRCKVFVKKDDAFGDRGVGQLFLKPVENSEKVQLIVRQDTSLGNLLLNLILSKSIPTQRMGKNNVMLVCIPDEKSKPPPVPVLLRVKTAEEADELLSVLEKYKK